MLSIVCAWCGAALGAKPGGEGVSHGICAICARRHFPEGIETRKRSGHSETAEEAKT